MRSVPRWAGPGRIIEDTDKLSRFQPGEVLVADITTLDCEPVMQIVATIVTQEPAIPAVLDLETNPGRGSRYPG